MRREASARGGASESEVRYTPYHPTWYRRRMPIFWWLGRRSYTKFIARELTSLFVAYTAALLGAQLLALARGPVAYARFTTWLTGPFVLAFHVFVFLALLFHAVTWFGLAPRALVIKVGGRHLPESLVAGAHYAGWAALSALLAWLVVGAG